MIKKWLGLVLGIISMLYVLQAEAQQPAYWKDIQAFKKLDSINAPKPGQILFIGSSSFTMWKDVQQYFPGRKIINRAFGGSTLQDQIHYAKDIILPYKPKQVVIYCGENDLASSDTVTAKNVFRRFELLYYFIRKHYPRASIVYVSMKPSPSRVHLMPKMVQGNKMIRNFLSRHNRNVFVNIYNKMLNPDGSPRDELFLDDKLHMNAKGYAIWQKAIAPHLMK